MPFTNTISFTHLFRINWFCIHTVSVFPATISELKIKNPLSFAKTIKISNKILKSKNAMLSTFEVCQESTPMSSCQAMKSQNEDLASLSKHDQKFNKRVKYAAHNKTNKPKHEPATESSLFATTFRPSSCQNP